MVTNLIGQKIKRERKTLNMTQKELAEGICTQAQISIIEKGDLNPTSQVLYLLSQKLNVDMNFFFDIENVQKEPDNIKKVKHLMRKFIRVRDYESLSYIVEKEKENSLFKTPEDQQFLLWHEGICDYYINSNVDDALNKLTVALDYLSDDATQYSEKEIEREIEILNSIAIIYNEENRNTDAIDIYTKAIEQFDNLPENKDQNIKIRLLYGLSKSLTALKRYEDSILYSKQGIEICVETEVLYLLGELLYQTGINLLNNKRIESGNEYLDKAIYIFEIQGKLSFINIIKKEKNAFN
ncbi:MULTISPECIES: helix-turn-helix domain-containing protein [Bacillus]|uniref:helix-turn-helix domain-containing protein n=1 Tax=Bacillus TaxID=1386 RepID=UPI0002D36F07|nr:MULTISPECIES: helix-turn-helix domain-containing protein [Bacillus]